MSIKAKGKQKMMIKALKQFKSQFERSSKSLQLLWGLSDIITWSKYAIMCEMCFKKQY